MRGLFAKREALYCRARNIDGYGNHLARTCAIRDDVPIGQSRKIQRLFARLTVSINDPANARSPEKFLRLAAIARTFSSKLSANAALTAIAKLLRAWRSRWSPTFKTDR
jgi:hypothetical protein